MQSSFKDSGTRLKTFSYSEDVQFESLAEPEAQLRPLYDVREAAYDTEVSLLVSYSLYASFSSCLKTNITVLRCEGVRM